MYISFALLHYLMSNYKIIVCPIKNNNDLISLKNLDIKRIMYFFIIIVLRPIYIDVSIITLFLLIS
jgi:hypothetical protein